MPGFDPSLCAYMTPGGQTVRLAPLDAGQALPALTFSTERNDAIFTVNVATEDETPYDLANATWRIEPAQTSYGKTVVKGKTAVFKPSPSPTGTAKITLYVPLKAGGQTSVSTTLVYGGNSFIADIRKDSVIRSGGTAKIESGLSVGIPGTYTVRLVETYSPSTGPERKVLREEQATFPDTKAKLFSETITYPTVTTKGEGWEYVWEVQIDEHTVARTRTLPLWVIGQDVQPQSLAESPVFTAADYPSIYTRFAGDSGKVAPAAGKTYADHVTKALYWLKAQNLGSGALGGPWLSFNSYFANLWYVDMEDVEAGLVPTYTIKHWDQWVWGYVLAGWYGDDLIAKPYPRSKVAVDVPIPDGVMPSNGTDRSIAIVGLRNGKPEKIWELWLAQKLGDGSWEAASIGVTSAANDWLHSTNYTVAASGISALAYALRVNEAKSAVDYIKAERAAGRVPSEEVIAQMIPHILALNLPDPSALGFSYPATHTDGTDNDPCTPREGELLYLDKNFDVAAQNYPPLTHAIAVVLKYRGAMVTDRTSWSTSLIVEGDFSYGGNIWSTIRESNESWALKYPDSAWVVGKIYADRAAWDADTGSGGYDMSVVNSAA